MSATEARSRIAERYDHYRRLAMMQKDAAALRQWAAEIGEGSDTLELRYRWLPFTDEEIHEVEFAVLAILDRRAEILEAELAEAERQEEAAE